VAPWTKAVAEQSKSAEGVRSSVAAEVRRLESQGSAIGWDTGLPFPSTAMVLDPSARLYVLSDGVFEIEKVDGEMWDFDKCLQFIARIPAGAGTMDCLLAHSCQLHGSDILAGDFSMLEILF
jgi:phosphoserine phosphatase RsbU/P